MGQEPCGRLSFLRDPKTMKGLPQTAICNLNFTLPTHRKEMESDPDDENDKDRRHTFASLALRKRYSYLADPASSPQSPCERTDLRMAIVADHLGLSWTELAREMNFSVDEINHIRTENPNSLTAQSFMLLKKWVSRDGKNATTDALTTVLTKVNRMDIVTLLEGPIFDYGWLSETANVNMEPPTSGRSHSSDLMDRQDNSQENSSDSMTSSSRADSGKPRQNGEHSDVIPHSSASQESANGVKAGALVAEHKVQGEEARNIPGESVSEEQFIDEDGNLITRKVIRKVICRVDTPTPDNQDLRNAMGSQGDSDQTHLATHAEGEVSKVRKKEEKRSSERKHHS